MVKTKVENKPRITTEPRHDVYNYDQRISYVFGQIKKEFSPENLVLVQKYDKLMVSLSMALATREKHLKTILNLNRFYENKDWEQISKEDVLDLVYRVMKSYSTDGQETNTTWDHKKILKIFVRWIKLGSRDYKEVGDPEETKLVKLKKIRDTIARENLLTESDRTRLLHVATHPRDKALIDVQFEAGTRPGELLSLKVKHVKFDKYGAIIKVDGKTGSRAVRLIKSAVTLNAWLNAHPFKDDPEAPFWPILTKQKYGQALSYYSARQIVAKICERAHLEKRVYLNLFRHSEATETANFMTEAQMKLRHGWTNASKMPARYVHLVQSDVDKVILERYGLKNNEKPDLKVPKKCPFCDQMNSPDVDRCEKCLKPLDLQAAMEKDEERELQKDELVRLGQVVDNLTRQKETEVQLQNDQIARQNQIIENMLNEIKELKKALSKSL